MTPEQQQALQEAASQVISDLVIGFTGGTKKLVIETVYLDNKGELVSSTGYAYKAVSTWKVEDVK